MLQCLISVYNKRTSTYIADGRLSLDLHEYLIQGAIFFFGLLIGSFLNVCIWRLPREESVVRPPSHCLSCGKQIGALDLIPVFSWLFLRGRCRYCGEQVSVRYPLVELLTGGMFLWSYLHFGFTWMSVASMVFAAFLILISFIDLDHQIILDGSLLLLGPAGLVLMGIFSPLEVWSMFAGGLAGFVLLLVLAVVSGGGMGGGDVKFAAALGFWLGWPMTLLGLFFGFIIGGVFSGVLLILKLRGRKDFIPFGPFIAIGAWIVFLYGNDILRWYLGFFQ